MVLNSPWPPQRGPGGNLPRRYTFSWEALVAGLRELHLELLLRLEQHAHILTAVLEPRHSNFFFDLIHDHLYARGFTIYPCKIPGPDP